MIRDREFYVNQSWHEYGLRPVDLLGWGFDDTEWLYTRQDALPLEMGPVASPPPHHRLG